METGQIGKRMIINVSGLIFETWDLTLERYPTTLLGDRQKRDKHYNVERNEYFFHRNRSAFVAILYFYQSDGRLMRPSDVSMDVFERECCFFELPISIITKMKSREGIIINRKRKEYDLGKFQTALWQFVENPESSLAARTYAAFALFMITFSIIIACLETLPSFEELFQDQQTDIRLLLEHIINGWFLFELIIRIAVSPNKFEFFKFPLNVIDTLAIVPYFLLQMIDKSISFSRTLQTLRFVRIIRLLRLGKNSARLKMVGNIFLSSFEDIKQLLLCLILVVIFGGSMIYFIEIDNEGTGFTSIPQSLWWAIQTVVVLGYGDIVPETVFGKVFASSFMVFGALTIALPVLSVVTKFTMMYSKNTDTEQNDTVM